MKRTPLCAIPKAIPEELLKFIDGADLYDSSCSPEARVYFIDKDDGYYLKIAAAGSLAREAMMNGYFHSLGLGVRVVSYLSGERDYMLTERAVGEDLTHESHLSDPVWLATEMGRLLRRLHETPAGGCPILRMPEYLVTVEENYKKGVFDPSFLPKEDKAVTAEEAYAYVMNNAARLRSDTLIHGDFCLPNVIFEKREFSKFIDVGNGGIGDRHVDLFWGAWTLGFNLGTDEYRDLFLDSYGRDLVDESLIRLIAFAECFG